MRISIKIKFIKLVIAFIVSLNCFSQSGKATYKVYHYFNNNQPKLIENLIFELNFNSTESLFKKRQKMNNDIESINNKIIERRVSNGIYYYNVTDDEKIRQLDILNIKVLVADSLLSKYWILKNSKKTINNIACNKAIIKLKDNSNKEVLVNAWYSPNISLPYGPKNYEGLPGLIVKLRENKVEFVLDSFILYEDEANVINKPDGKLMTYEEIINFIAKSKGIDRNKLLKTLQKN